MEFTTRVIQSLAGYGCVWESEELHLEWRGRRGKSPIAGGLARVTSKLSRPWQGDRKSLEADVYGQPALRDGVRQGQHGEGLSPFPAHSFREHG